MLARSAKLLLLMSLLLAVACAPKRSVRVEPDGDPGSAAPVRRPLAAGEYEVVRGDTLYGIAFRHGMDYRELAARNGIQSPYTIYPGQRLRIAAASVPAVSAPAKPTAATRATIASAPAERTPIHARGDTEPARGVVGPIARAGRNDPAAPSLPQATPATDASAPATAATPATPSQQAVTASGTDPLPAPSAPTPAAGDEPAPAKPVTADALASLPKGSPRWQWPSDGALIGTFLAGDPTRQGINLAGNAGDPVRAAADGVVVYSGSGLIGYGELIIVKHNETWLSAYGHNRKRLVNEGAAVKAGQLIAEMGRSGASRDMLHFEVRQNGRSINPVGVLPKR